MMTPPAQGRLAYLASRHPVVSHTFVDNEILALEAAGWELVVASLNPPKDDFLHPRLHQLHAPRLYPPPAAVLDQLIIHAKRDGRWPEKRIADHRQRFGQHTKPALRARNALWLADSLTRLGVAHVHLHFANAATHSALFLEDIAGIGYSFTPQARDFLIETEAELLNELCARARFVVAPCGYAAEALRQRAPASSSKIVQIYNGIDPSPYLPASPNSEGVRRILSVGRLVEIKGFPELLEAFARTQQKQADLQLRIIGDGPLRPQLKARIAALGLQDSIHLLGQQSIETMREEMAAADLFALAARPDQEGGSDMLPTVITEAMFCALPVLSTCLAGIPEQVIDGQTGLLVESGDDDSLTTALGRLVNEPSLAAQLGQAGLKRAHGTFNQAETLPQLAAAFRNHWPAAIPVQTTEPSVGQAITLGYYDLAQPKRLEWLLAESAVLLEQGSEILVSGRPSKFELEQLEPLLPQLRWLPDGMVLEQAWQANPSARAVAAQWRMNLSSAIDGEALLAAARRACWIARSWRKPGQSWFAPGTAESLVLVLAGHFLSEQLPEADERNQLLSCFDSARDWNGKVIRHLAQHSTRFDDPSERTDQATDHLLHGDPQPRYLKIGPLTRRLSAEPISSARRAQALRQWLDE